MAYRHQSERWFTENVQTATTGEAIGFKGACVKLSASRTIVKTTADTDVACGLSKDSYSSGDKDAEYLEKGDLRFVAGGAISINDPLCPDDGTAGRVRTAVSGDRVIGFAKEEASGAGVFCLGKFDFVNSYLLA